MGLLCIGAANRDIFVLSDHFLVNRPLGSKSFLVIIDRDLSEKIFSFEFRRCCFCCIELVIAKASLKKPIEDNILE